MPIYSTCSAVLQICLLPQAVIKLNVSTEEYRSRSKIEGAVIYFLAMVSFDPDVCV